jgi:hypothetical protein
MTERPQDEPRPGVPASHDPTRDIRLPALADRPPSAMPREWAGLTAPAPAAPPPTSSPQASDAAPDSAPGSDKVPAGTPLPSWVRGVEDGPTDQLARPAGPPREKTIAFSAPEMTHRPAAPVQVARTPRRWPWIVLVLLPILIIAGTGITLLLMFQGW